MHRCCWRSCATARWYSSRVTATTRVPPRASTSAAYTTSTGCSSLGAARASLSAASSPARPPPVPLLDAGPCDAQAAWNIRTMSQRAPAGDHGGGPRRTSTCVPPPFPTAGLGCFFDMALASPRRNSPEE
ncbi:hypothetical protein ACN28S_18790 [Cystobacter fuscus]